MKGNKRWLRLASIDRPTQQVAALSEQVETSRRRGGNNSRQARRVERNTAIICFNCGRRGHIARFVVRKTPGQRGACSGQHAPQHPVSPSKVILVAAVKSKIATLMGSVGDTAAEIMLDSRSSVSLLRQELAQKAT